MKLKFCIILAFAVFFLNSCVHLPKQNIADIEGVWESITLGYNLLVIDSDGSGYLIFAITENDVEVFEIVKISFTDSGFNLLLSDYAKKEKDLNLQGYAWNNRLFLKSQAKGSSKKDPEDTMFFLKERETDLLK